LIFYRKKRGESEKDSKVKTKGKKRRIKMLLYFRSGKGGDGGEKAS